MKNGSKRIVVVTGGSRGIGRTICQRFAEDNTIVYFSYNSDLISAKKTSKIISNSGFKTIYKQLNVACFVEVMEFFKTIIKEFGRIDVLVNNAGINKDVLLVRTKEKDWNNIIDVNLKGTFNCIQATSRIMLNQKYGRIVNIASIAGKIGNPGQTSYSAAKAGIIGLTKAAAREMASRNITVNAVAPGYIKTDMTQKFAKNNTDIIKAIPLGRIGNPKDVSNAAYFLASEDASYITGHVINVSGGLYM